MEETKVSLKELSHIVNHVLGVYVEYKRNSWYIGVCDTYREYEEDTLYKVLDTFFNECCIEYIDLEDLFIDYDFSAGLWSFKMRDFEDNGELEELIEELIKYLAEEE